MLTSYSPLSLYAKVCTLVALVLIPISYPNHSVTWLQIVERVWKQQELLFRNWWYNLTHKFSALRRFQGTHLCGRNICVLPRMTGPPLTRSIFPHGFGDRRARVRPSQIATGHRNDSFLPRRNRGKEGKLILERANCVLLYVRSGLEQSSDSASH